MAGLQNSSAAMSVANNSLEETIALIASGTEIVQDASQVGRTIVPKHTVMYGVA